MSWVHWPELPTMSSSSATGHLRVGKARSPRSPDNVVAMLPLAGMVDLDAERDRLRKEIAAAVAERDRAQSQLGNEAFISRAPEHVVETQRRRLATAEEQISLLERRLTELDA